MRSLNALSESFIENHPAQAALALDGVDEKALALFFSRLAPRVVSKVIEHLDPEVAAACLGRMTPPKAASILEALSPHARIIVLRRVKAERRENTLSALSTDVAEQTRRLLRFADDSVAELMDTDALTLSQDMRTDQALRRIRRRSQEFEGEIYIVDRQFRPVGMTTLHALLKAPHDQLVSANAGTEYACVRAEMPLRELVSHPLWADHNRVAVVDEDDVLLGVIDHRTVAKARERLQMHHDNSGGLDAALALGELYWVGITGMLDGLAGRISTSMTTEGPEYGSIRKN